MTEDDLACRTGAAPCGMAERFPNLPICCGMRPHIVGLGLLAGCHSGARRTALGAFALGCRWQAWRSFSQPYGAQALLLAGGQRGLPV